MASKPVRANSIVYPDNTLDSGFVGAAAEVTGGSLSYTANTPIVFGTERYDTEGAYDPATGIFMAPEPGAYLICGSIQWNGSGAYFFFWAQVNGVDTNMIAQVQTALYGYSLPFSTVVRANTGDRINLSASVTQTIGGSGSSYFTITKI